MTILDRISLIWRYGKGIFIIGAVYTWYAQASKPKDSLTRSW